MNTQSDGMRVVRSLYVYAMTVIALALSAVGAYNLLLLGIDRVLVAITDVDWVQGGPDWEREKLSLFLPFVVIATPIWWLHWRMAERALHGEHRQQERASVIRSLYPTVMLAISLQFSMTSLLLLISLAVQRWTGYRLAGFERSDVVTSLAMVMVAAAIWLWHFRIYRHDLEAGPIASQDALLPEAYFYIAAAIGIVLAFISAGGLLGVAIDALLDARIGVDWWRDPLSVSISTTIVGILVWLLHWRFTERLLAQSAWWGKGRNESRLRQVVLGAVMVIAAFVVLRGVALGIDQLLLLVMDIRGSSGGRSRVAEIVGPPLVAVPGLTVLLLVVRRMLADPQRSPGSAPVVSIRRYYGYVLALLGLAFTGFGLARLVGAMIQRLADDAVREQVWLGQVAWSSGVVVAGVMLWGSQWLAIRRRLNEDPEDEQASTTRRAYLFLVLGSGMVALVVGIAMTVYRILRQLLEVEESVNMLADMSLPLGMAMVAAVVSVSHGILLRRDLKVRPIQGAASPVNEVTIVLAGPAGADFDSVIESLRASLPEGFRIAEPAHRAPSTPEDSHSTHVSASESVTPQAEERIASGS